MALIKYFKDIPQGSTPGARFALNLETHFTYCPEKINATFAPIPKRGSTMKA
jgi:hypothetical protein